MAEKEENLLNQLDGGTYEILQNRLRNSADDLRNSLSQLNEERKQVFGSIETSLIATERVTTEYNCVPNDMIPVGDYFIFGYNIHMGLKSETSLADVFSIYTYQDHQFHQEPLDLINDKRFLEDFQKLYKYYKSTRFVKFFRMGVDLHMVFRIGKDVTDIKTFKWKIGENSLKYADNRSDHEFRFPAQHDFEWIKTTREDYREGRFSHVSIEDRLFVETIGGDLTIKIEDNTDDGQGIYAEPVVHLDQTLDDALIYYAIVGNIILLKIRPYQEDVRYIVYNSKVNEARRIDEIGEACILLPDDHGLIFSNGYYLQTGEFKQFEIDLRPLIFERRLPSPNGEDYLYVFYNRQSGTYLLMHYNIIEQKVDRPTLCHGFSIFENGEMCLFKGDDEPKKHHTIQIWKTPYTSPDYKTEVSNDSFLFKIGNKDIVRAMAECQELLNLISKDDQAYSGLYIDLVNISTDILDSYHWLDHNETFHLNTPLDSIRGIASSTIDEFEKVQRIRENTRQKTEETTKKADQLIRAIRKTTSRSVDDYVGHLAEIRAIRGEVISLKDLRYADLETIEKYDQELEEFNDSLSENCVKFMLRDDALMPYEKRVESLRSEIEEVKKVTEADESDKSIDEVSRQLELLIEIVSNLEITDATQTTRIIDNISAIYTQFNQLRAALKQRRKQLFEVEGKAEFNAQLKLIDQAVINYIDVCDTPEKTDEYLSKVMLQLEELEGKFAEFDDFIDKITTKREEAYNAFESRKLNLIEARSRRASTLYKSGERILNTIKNRIEKLESVAEINGYFASDLMIEKIRGVVKELEELGDNIKSEDLLSKLKTLREDAVRQLKDRQELFVDGADMIRMGDHVFAVSTQSMDVTLIKREGELYFHLSGTGFFEKANHGLINKYENVIDQMIVSENNQVYRAEYLAYLVFNEIRATGPAELERWMISSEQELADHLTTFMSVRFNEGYIKGVHDQDALKILRELLNFWQTSDLLRYSPLVRAVASLFWHYSMDEEQRKFLDHQLKGAGIIMSVFPGTHEFDAIIAELEERVSEFLLEFDSFGDVRAGESAEYLFYEIARGRDFVIDRDAHQLILDFKKYLTSKKALKSFQDSIKGFEDNYAESFRHALNWINSYLWATQAQGSLGAFAEEAAVNLLVHQLGEPKIIHAIQLVELEGMHGNHQLINDGKLELNFINFLDKLKSYREQTVPLFQSYQEEKKHLTQQLSEDLRLDEYKPRVLSSFVRNQLIDKVYFPLIGANLAKQIGTAGEDKRTDLMGLLLLISPPGYGKTTLMEYIAKRLGLTFMKINGPALGHQVLSLDPEQAPNAGAREELHKLNLAFEMGDNVMIYLDDIQHCHPEFLQKFISLCDAQRKIEGVYKGKSRTYDFRGRRLCVVMAGNPYTESGEKFRIPDMLANRADIYNLGDIIGDTEDVFKLSYLENSLTSNPVLGIIAGKSHKDALQLIGIAEGKSREGMDFELNHSPEEMEESISILKKLLVVREVILSVNQEYIQSAAQSDEYRTEPPFKLQGSYRDMNKITEKIVSVMNDEELQTLIMSHYESESQTLTSDAEANLLKFKSLMGWLSKEEEDRWKDILERFRKQQEMMGYGQNNQTGLVIKQMETISRHLDGIRMELSIQPTQTPQKEEKKVRRTKKTGQNKPDDS